MVESVVVERQLGPGENFFRCRTDAGFYCNFASVAAYSLDISKDWVWLYKALRKSILDYHVLICNVFKDLDRGVCVVRPIKSAKFGDMVVFRPESFSPHGQPVSEKFIHDLCRTAFFTMNSESSTFRVFIAGTHDVGVAFEHTMADGVVANYFQEILLSNLAYCSHKRNDAEYVELYGALPSSVDLDTEIFNYENDKKYLRNSLPPAIEMIMQNPSVDFCDNDPNHYSKVLPDGFSEKWPGRFVASRDYTAAFKLFNIPADQFAQILRVCKANGVTFTSYLNCMQAVALQPIYGDKHYTSSSVAVTLRRFLDPEKVDPSYRAILNKNGYRMLGNFAHMGVPEFFPPMKEFSWDFVRKVNNKMVQSLKNDKLLNLKKRWYDESTDVGENLQFFVDELGKNKGDTIKISNIGLAKFPEYDLGDGIDRLTINDIVFAQDVPPNASDFTLNLVSSLKGGLNVIMTYVNHSFDDTQFDNFDAFPGILKSLLLKHAGISQDNAETDSTTN